MVAYCQVRNLKALIQRVDQAEVAVRGKSIASIKQGLLVFLGIYKTDTKDDVFNVCKKILYLRIFNDENDKINYNIQNGQTGLNLDKEYLLYTVFQVKLEEV